jgi:hypothetical protein
MPGFDFFRSQRRGYVPRTPSAALRAMATGAALPEHFIWASCSAKPLDEEPFDLEAIERTLARPDMNLQTAKLLKEIFEKMIANREPEVALFGAEGINTLEGRSINRIERLKRALAKDEAGGPPKKRRTLRELSLAYYELAELHGKARSIRAFYLREAYSALRMSLAKGSPLSRDTLGLGVDILIGLGLYDQAADLLKKIKPPDHPFVLLLTARVAFHKKEFAKVIALCRGLASHELEHDEALLAEFWAGD